MDRVPSDAIHSEAKACAAIHTSTTIVRPTLSAATRSFSFGRFIRCAGALVPLSHQWTDKLTLGGRLAESERHDFIAFQSAGDFAIDSVIKAKSYIDEMNSPVAHDRDVNPLAVKNQRFVRDSGRSAGTSHRDCSGRIHSGIQRKVLIGKIDLEQHRPGTLVERTGVAGNRSVVVTLGILVDRDYR